MNFKTLALALGLAAAQLLSPSAFAQEPASASPVTPSAKQTPEQKAAGRAKRKAEGTQAQKDYLPSPSVRMPPPKAKVSRAEKDAARAERKAETVRAQKAGQLPTTGEPGPSK